MKILAIDPGSTQSAYLVWNGKKVEDAGKILNTELRDYLIRAAYKDLHHLVIEKVTIYQRADNNIHDTILWTGRFIEAWTVDYSLVTRSDVKSHLCPGLKGANDSTVIAALKDRFGRPSTKKNGPNLVYDKLKADEWQAFALAVTWWDLNMGQQSKAS